MNDRIGHPNQLAGFYRFRFAEGAMDGLEAIEVYNETGLRFTVLVGRGLDIGPASYKGINLSYMASPGLTAPAYCQNGGKEWGHSFSAGLLFTCGLDNVGPDHVVGGVAYGQHGRYSSLTAEQVSMLRTERDCAEGDVLEIRGTVRQSAFFGENLTLERTIRTYARKNVIEIEDVITNRAFSPAPLMLLYHCNYGYPLLNEGTRLTTDSAEIFPRDEEAAKGLYTAASVLPPQADFAEQVFFHKGTGKAALCSSRACVTMDWDRAALPCFTQWNMFGKGEYVMGLEPGNCYPIGRAAALESAETEWLQAGESKRTSLRFCVGD